MQSYIEQDVVRSSLMSNVSFRHPISVGQIIYWNPKNSVSTSRPNDAYFQDLINLLGFIATKLVSTTWPINTAYSRQQI